MGSKMMKRSSLIAWLAAAALALAGCSAQLTVPASGTPAETLGDHAALSLTFDMGRQVQLLREDVTGATVSLTVNGRAPIVKSFMATEFATESLDFSGLPGGDALVRVEAYMGPTMVGMRELGVPLVVGRRTFASVNVPLDSHGKINDQPMTPLGPMPDPTARLYIQQVVFHTAGSLAGKEELILVNRTGHPIYDFNTYSLEYQDGGNDLRSSIYDWLNNSVAGYLDTDATMSIILDSNGYPSGTTVFPGMGMVTFASSTVSMSAGSVALLKTDMGQERVMDFVQWGASGYNLEARAVQAGLWPTSGYLTVPDSTNYEGFQFSVLQPGVKGIQNWNGGLLAPLTL